MIRLRRLFLLICPILFLWAPGLFAADEWLPVDPADLKMTSEPNAPGADAVILYREETYNDMMNFQSYYFRVKILTDKGVEQWRTKEIPYIKVRMAKVAGIRARTIHADGTVIPFDGQSFDKVAVKGHGVKVFVRAFALPQVEVGSIIEYKYELSWDDVSLLGADWDVQTDVYQRKAVFHYIPYNFVRQSVIVTDANGEILNNVNYVPFLPPTYPKIVTKNLLGKASMDLAVENVPAIQKEQYMPPADQISYRVRFFYTNGETASAGTDDFWKESSKFWNRSVEKFLGHGKNLSGAVEGMVASTDTAEQKARKIYAAVQKLENMSYGRSHTTEENKNDKPPKSAEDVLEQKRGSASDLTRLYVALARAANLHAYLMRVSSRDKWLFQKAVLDSSQLDSEIAIVEIDGKEVYLDPGTKFCPYGLLNWMKTLVSGQRQTASGKIEFETTPDSPAKDNQIIHIADMKLSEDGDITGKVTMGFTGEEGIKRRQAVLEVDEQQRKKDFEDELATWLPAGSKVALEQIWNQDDIDKPLIVRFAVSVFHFGTATGKRLLVPAALFHNEDTQAFMHPNRVQAVYFEFSSLAIDEMTLHLPDSLKISDLPKESKDQKEFCAYATKITNGNQTVKFRRELLMAHFVIPVSSYPTLQAFYERVRNGDEQQAVFEFASDNQVQSTGGK